MFFSLLIWICSSDEMNQISSNSSNSPAAMQEIKEELHSNNLRVKSMAVLKLAYLNMLGYDILWASLSIVDCMSRGDKMSLKRPAYLAANFCFQDRNDLGLMLINHYKKELTSGFKSQTEIGGGSWSFCGDEVDEEEILLIMKIKWVIRLETAPTKMIFVGAVSRSDL